MLVRLNKDNNLSGGIEMTEWVESEVTTALERYGTQITRVEVYMSDENSHKEGGLDKTCKLEARLAGIEPIVVTQAAGDFRSALDMAIETLRTTIDRRVEKLRDPKGRVPFSGGPSD